MNPQDKTFVPLHVHSMYSRLIGGDGFCFPRELAQRAKDIGCPAIALTDHGTLAGTTEFYRDCQKIGIKPILGMEAYITPMGHSLDERVVYDVKDMRGKPGYIRNNYHLNLWAKDDEGWSSLMELSKQSYAKGYYYKPRIDHELLMEHHKGLICGSACVLGEIASMGWCGDYEKARQTAQWYQELFGEDYYLEVMYHGLDMERAALAPVRDIARELGIKIIATNDSHYAVKSEYKLHKALMLDKMHKSFADSDVSGSFFGDEDEGVQSGVEEEGGDSNPIFETSSELYIKDWDEMVAALALEGATEDDVATELTNTLEIADKCNFDLPLIDMSDMSAYYTPVYPVEKDLQYDAFKESGFEIKQSTVDAIIDEMHKDGREGDKLEDFLNDHEMLSLRFLMWMCDKGLRENVLPKLKARGEALPMEFWCDNPPEGFSIRHTHNSPDELWIREQMRNGLSVDDMIKVYQERIDYEVSVVVRKGFIDYFSVVQNYANFTKLNGSVMGPGRGSGGGSLLLYLLSITSIDPIPNKLLFFRFLNPDRKGYPDVDLDWSADFRDNRLKPYLREFYGDDYCAQVATYMYYWGKAAIKAAARILFPMPDSVQIGTTLSDALDDKPKLDLNKELDGSNPQFEQLVNSRIEYKQTIELARMIQGRLSGESIHASAYIVSPRKLTDFVPLSVTKDERARAQKEGTEIKEYLIQLDGNACAEYGLVKLDLLCVVDLEMMEMTCKAIERVYGCKINLERIPLDDAAVWTMLQEHLVAGIFQLDGSEGMAKVMDQVRPENIENINAIVALYRPGPMDYIPNYVEGKKHPEKVHYLDERLRPILQDTYGVVCVAAGTLVSTENGKKAIEEISVGDRVYAEDGCLHNVSAFYDNGIKETLRIRGTYGEELVCTPDHKILTSDGWVEAGDLKPGMLMKCGNPYKMAGELRTPEPFNWEEWFIGLFLADGYSAKSTPTIACASEEYAEELARQSREHFPNMQGIRTYHSTNGTGGTSWYVSFAQRAGRNGSFSANYQENELNQLLRKYNLWHCTRDKKRLPSDYSYSMLIGMFEGDGCGINKRLNLKYEGLARDFYEAALSYGLNVSLYKRDESSWTVSISGDIASIFPFNIRRYDPRVEKCHSASAKDIYIPRKSLVGYPSLIKKSQIFRHGQLENIPSISVSSAKANGLTDADYESMHQEWSKVLSVIPAGKHHVYDVTVDDVHQFIAGNIIISNCFQEEAMQITQAIGQFSGGEADTYRKYAAKKYPDKLAQMGDMFISRAIENNTKPEVAEELWTQLVKFGSYAFNRCITGDTLLHRTAACPRDKKYPGMDIPVAEVYRRFHASAARNSPDLPIRSKYRSPNPNRGLFVSCRDADGRSRRHKVKNVYEQGVRDIYLVTLENGKSVKATDNHRFQVADGSYKMVSELEVDKDELWCCDFVYDNKKTRQYTFSTVSDSDFESGHRATGHSYGSHRGFKTGADNPSWTGGGYTQFAAYKKSFDGVCEECGRKLDEGERFETHHVNGDRSDNSAENLMNLCVSCHKKLDYAMGRRRNGDKGYETYLSRVVSIEPAGREMTYDIEIESDEHNFFANGICSHNSHSAAYALIAYRGAFLKAHFPECFFASLCTLKPKAKKTNKVPEYLNEARQMGVVVKPPHVNYSEAGFDVPERGVIAFGLGGISGVGSAANYIVEERHAHGPFKDFSDFMTRVPREVGKGALLPLMKHGALDGLGWSRKAMVESIDQIIDFRKRYFASQEQRRNLAIDLFSLGEPEQSPADEGSSILLTPPFDTEYNKRQMLEMEKRNFGTYLSGSPEDYRKLSRYATERRIGTAYKQALQDAKAHAQGDGAAEVPAKPIHVGDIDGYTDARRQNGTRVEFLCIVSDPISKNRPNPFMFRSGKGCSVAIQDWGVLEESRMGFAPRVYKSRLTIFSRTLERISLPQPGDLLRVRGKINIDETGEWPNSVIVDELEPIPDDNRLIGMMGKDELLDLQRRWERVSESLGDPSSDMYVVLLLEFPSKDALEAFSASVTEGMRGTGHVLVSVADDDSAPQDMSLRPTVSVVNLARRFGADVRKRRLPKAQSAIERMKLMRGAGSGE